MTVNDLIKALEDLKRRDLDNGDLPVVLGLTEGSMPDEVFIEHYDGDPKICAVKDERLGPELFGRFS
jgi:hypothetical protein